MELSDGERNAKRSKSKHIRSIPTDPIIDSTCLFAQIAAIVDDFYSEAKGNADKITTPLTATFRHPQVGTPSA